MARPAKRSHTRNLIARKVIPADVRHLFGGQREFVRSLGTSDERAARRLHAEVLAQWEAQIAAARAQQQGNFQYLAQREVLALCGEWYAASVSAHERDPGSEADWDGLFEAVRHECDEGAMESQGVEGDYVPNQHGLASARELLRERGIAADPDSLRRFAVEFLRTRVRLAQTMTRRAQGDYGADHLLSLYPTRETTPAAAHSASAQSASSAPLTADELLNAWAAEKDPAPNTLKKYRIAFRNVSRILGFDDARRITVEDVVRFKQKRLTTERRDVQTVADDVQACNAVCGWATKQKLMVGNPFAGLAPQPRRRGPKSRLPYNDEEAARILLLARSETGWKRWLPWLLAFSGARISEIVEMRRHHVRMDSGVHILDLFPLRERKGKNDIFQRMLPIHPSVIAEGFLDYVAALPSAPDGPLFPDLAVAKDGTRTTTATTQHGRWIRSVAGIDEPEKAPTHSWRHRIQDELRKVRALPEIGDAITGRHNPRNAGDGYGVGFRGMPDEVLRDLRKVPNPIDMMRSSLA